MTFPMLLASWTSTRPPRKEEREDAYGRYAGKTILRGPLEKTAFPNTSQAEPFYTLNVTMGLVPVDQILGPLHEATVPPLRNT